MNDTAHGFNRSPGGTPGFLEAVPWPLRKNLCFGRLNLVDCRPLASARDHGHAEACNFKRFTVGFDTRPTDTTTPPPGAWPGPCSRVQACGGLR